MRISVALCVYNGEKYLAEQLDSIGRQERTPDEVVICDDGSSDRSAEIIGRFAVGASFPVRYFRNETNLRTTKNFERAIGLCDGDVIATSDQDDVWYTGKLSRIEAEFDRAPDVGLIFSDANLIDGDGRPLGVRLWPTVRCDPAKIRGIATGDTFRVLLRRPIITGATMAFRSDLRRILLPIEPRWYHDEWAGLLAAAASKVTAIAEPLIEYRRHSNNQVGIIGVTAVERARAALGGPRDFFLAKAENLEKLRERLAERVPGRPDLMAELDRKVAHYRARGSLPRSRVRRLPGVLGELLSLRYTRYSGSTLSFARDLLAEQ